MWCYRMLIHTCHEPPASMCWVLRSQVAPPGLARYLFYMFFWWLEGNGLCLVVGEWDAWGMGSVERTLPASIPSVKPWPAFQRKTLATNFCSSFLSVALIKNKTRTFFYQEQLREGKDLFGWNVYLWGKLGQGLKQNLEAETMEECNLLTCLLAHAWELAFLYRSGPWNYQQWAGPSHIY